MPKLYKSIGLMSGTSSDGIDLAFIESDGQTIINRLNFAYKPYDLGFRERLSALAASASYELEEIKSLENELTLLHADLANDFLAKHKINRSEIDLIAFHGHTILHVPKRGITWQIGNGHLLAAKTGINVVADFRSKDVVLNGQGAPLVPIYHFHILRNQTKPVAALNVGGISNITYLENDSEDGILAFDLCFGNAPFDDLMKEKFGKDFDQNGELSKSGNADFILADHILRHDLFHKKPPKSFSRDDFAVIVSPIKNLKVEDALATFAYLHARAIELNLEFLPQRPKEIFVCGGGRKNAAIMNEMRKFLTGVSVKPIDEIGFNGDAIEAEAFAFLGIRSLLGMSISFQKTTGISPENNYALASSRQFQSCGGVVYRV